MDEILSCFFFANLRYPEAEPEEETPKDNATNSGGNNYCNTSINHSIFQTLKKQRCAQWIFDMCAIIPLTEFFLYIKLERVYNYM